MSPLLVMRWAAVALAGQPARLDYSALDPATSGYPVARDGHGLCGSEGARDGTVLAAAIVTYGRRPGRSTWGHTSLRFLACDEGLLRDVEYEYYRMDDSIERFFVRVHAGEAWTTDQAFLRRQYGQLMVVRNERPVDGGFYAVELAKNREVVEAWMPWSAELRQRLLATLDTRYAEQVALLAARTDLDGLRYAPMGMNCTRHIREALAAENGAPGGLEGSVFPIRNLRALEARSDVRFVLHPSTHVLRQEMRDGVLPRTTSTIPKGLWRRRMSQTQTELVTAALSQETPVVLQWLADGTLQP